MGLSYSAIQQAVKEMYEKGVWPHILDCEFDKVCSDVDKFEGEKRYIMERSLLPFCTAFLVAKDVSDKFADYLQNYAPEYFKLFDVKKTELKQLLCNHDKLYMHISNNYLTFRAHLLASAKYDFNVKCSCGKDISGQLSLIISIQTSNVTLEKIVEKVKLDVVYGVTTIASKEGYDPDEVLEQVVHKTAEFFFKECLRECEGTEVDLEVEEETPQRKPEVPIKRPEVAQFLPRGEQSTIDRWLFVVGLFLLPAVLWLKKRRGT